jgi:uncharacterized protein YfaS (alpha-2-macroglobulin family)
VNQWTGTNIALTINDGTDTEVFSESTVQMETSSFAYTYKVPEDASGGEYLIKLAGYNVPCTSKITRVRDYDRQQLVIQTEWDRDTYFPEDMVSGTIYVKAADGYPFTKAPSIEYSIGFGDYAIPVSKSGEKLNIENGVNTYRIAF